MALGVAQGGASRTSLSQCCVSGVGESARGDRCVSVFWTSPGHTFALDLDQGQISTTGTRVRRVRPDRAAMRLEMMAWWPEQWPGLMR